jgi:hypothetical protein
MGRQKATTCKDQKLSQYQAAKNKGKQLANLPPDFVEIIYVWKSAFQCGQSREFILLFLS